MKLSEFRALKVGDVVTVVGEQDGRKFNGERATVVNVNDRDMTHGCVVLLFDKWSQGHGVGSRHWAFFCEDVKGFTIKLVPPSPAAEKPKKAPKGPQAYKGNGKHEWEVVTGQTVRLRVPGGWLYGKSIGHQRVMASATFVPVPSVVGYSI